MKSYKETLTEAVQTLWAIGVSARAVAEKLAVMLDGMDDTTPARHGLTDMEANEFRCWCRQQSKDILNAQFSSIQIVLDTGFYTGNEAAVMLDRQVIIAEEMERRLKWQRGESGEGPLLNDPVEQELEAQLAEEEANPHEGDGGYHEWALGALKNSIDTFSTEDLDKYEECTELGLKIGFYKPDEVPYMQERLSVIREERDRRMNS